MGFVLGARGFLDTNMLILVMENRRVGGFAQCEAQKRMGLCSGEI